jgi:hypothetical protein
MAPLKNAVAYTRSGTRAGDAVVGPFLRSPGVRITGERDDTTRGEEDRTAVCADHGRDRIPQASAGGASGARRRDEASTSAGKLSKRTVGAPVQDSE